VPRKRLTANFVERVKPDPHQSQVDYTDTWRPRPGVSFGLRVGRRTKTFVMFYRSNGRWQRLTLGRYRDPGFTLADAHDEAVRRVSEVIDGQDPAGRRRADKAAGTVADLVKRYVDEYARPRKRSWERDRELLNREVVPEWGEWKAHEVAPEHVDALVAGIARRGAPVKANRVLAVIRKMYAWAAAPGRRIVRYNPAAGVEAPAAESSRDRVFSDAEIGELWRRYGELYPLSRDCLRVIAAMAQRPGEVMRMRKADIDGRWWTIPAADTKNGLPHRVYLTEPAWSIVEPRLEGESPYVFPSRHDPDRPIGTLQKAQERARAGREATGTTPERSAIQNARIHDWRRTAASRMASRGIPRHVVGRVLNHAEQGVTATYDRHSYDAEKREALETWGNELQRLADGNG